MIDELKNQVINEFSSEITQKIYIKKTNAGLWGSEEFLIKKYFIPRSEEHTSELQSHSFISYAVFCLKKKKRKQKQKKKK